MDTDWRTLTRAAYVVAGHLDAAAGDTVGADPDVGDDGTGRAGAGRHRARPPRAWWSRRPARVVAAVLALFAVGVAVRGCVAEGATPVDVPPARATDALAADDPAAGATASPSPDLEPGSREAPEPTASPPATLVIHVAGAVAAPGLVELPAGARVGDAITAAGGALPGAQLDAVNLARPLADGEQVRLPAEGEEVPAPVPTPGGAAPIGGGSGAAPPAGPVDLNAADAAALDTLPGIGPALAARILEHREAIGGFTSVDELDDVSGIGPVVMERLRPLVAVW